VEIQNLGTTLSFAFSAPETIASSQANQYDKGTVQALNGKMHLPMKPLNVHTRELRHLLQKLSWPLPAEDTDSPGGC